MKWYKRLFNSGEGRRGLLAGILIAFGFGTPAAFLISDTVNTTADTVIEARKAEKTAERAEQ